MLQRQPATDILRRIEEEKARVEQMIADRAAAHPPRIRDVTYSRQYQRDYLGRVPPGTT